MGKIRFSEKQIGEFEKMGINVIYLFGSRAKGITTSLSDFDFGIVFENPEKYRDTTLDVYNKLYEIFVDILPKKYLRQRFKMREHEFDIVFLQFASPSLQFSAIKEGQILYEKDKEKRLDYEEYVMKICCDLKYFFDIRYQAILERI